MKQFLIDWILSTLIGLIGFGIIAYHVDGLLAQPVMSVPLEVECAVKTNQFGCLGSHAGEAERIDWSFTVTDVQGREVILTGTMRPAR